MLSVSNVALHEHRSVRLLHLCGTFSDCTTCKICLDVDTSCRKDLLHLLAQDDGDGLPPEEAPQPGHLAQRQVVLGGHIEVCNSQQTDGRVQVGDGAVNSSMEWWDHCNSRYTVSSSFPSYYEACLFPLQCDCIQCRAPVLRQILSEASSWENSLERE